MRLSSLVLVLIACSTWLKLTSCCVNWLVSSGDSGSWFLSCVVSNVRNVWKSLPRPTCADDAVLDELPDAAAVDELLVDDAFWLRTWAIEVAVIVGSPV